MRKLCGLVLFSMLGVARAHAQTAADPMAVPNIQFLNCSTGICNPLGGGTVTTYIAGTTTPLATCASSSLTAAACTTPNSNPIQLNSSGFNAAGSGNAGIWPLPTRCYKFLLKDSDGNTIWTTDNICNRAGILQAALAASSGSSLVGYKYSSSATVRTVQSRLQDAASALDFGCVADGSTDTTACQTALFAAGIGHAVYFPPGSYACNNPTQATVLTVSVASFYAEGVTFPGCRYTNTSAITVIGAYFDTSAYPYVDTAKGPVWQVAHDSTHFIDVRFAYRINYTAIQIGGASGGPACIDDVSIDTIRTETNGQSHITITCATNVRINNWQMDAGVTNDGLNIDDGLALFGLSGASHNITITNVTASNVYDILKIVNNEFEVSNVTLTGATCYQCVAPIYLQGATTGAAVTVKNVNISNVSAYDPAGTHMVNLILATSAGVGMSNVSFAHMQGYGRFNNTSQQSWIELIGTSSAVFDRFTFTDISLVNSGGSGVPPSAVVTGTNDAAWTNFQFKNITANGSTGACLNLGGVQFAAQKDLSITDSHFSGCQSDDTTVAAHNVRDRVDWERNLTILADNEPEIASANEMYPIGVTFTELSSAAYTGIASGTTLYCYDCFPSAPASAGTASDGGSYCTITPSGVWNCDPKGVDKHSGLPTLSGCGTSPTVTNTDRGGFLVTGSGTVTVCTLTYSAAFSTQVPVSVTLLTPGGSSPAITRIDGTGSPTWTEGFTITGTNLQGTTFSWIGLPSSN